MKSSILKAFLAMLFCLILNHANAGGPFFVTSDGTAIKWKDNVLKWTADGGPLNASINATQAKELIQGLFEIWANASLTDAYGNEVVVTDIGFEDMGALSEDVNEDNYIDVVNANMGESVIVFDDNGAIIDLELGEKASEYVVGFASPFSTGRADFAGGIIVLNGRFLDGDEKDGIEVDKDEFRAAALHEIGHLLNIDHTQANIEAVKRVEDGDESLIDDIPTMYPVLVSADQLKLHTDDIVALANIYPSEAYLDDFCAITGTLEGVDGEGFQGADVIARATDPIYEWGDARTFVSGVMYPEGAKEGGYVLGGLVPGREYSISYRGISPSFTNGSSIAPYDPPRSDVISATIAERVVACQKGGVSYVADTANVESKEALTLTPSTGGSSDDYGSLDTSSSSPSGGCSLIIR